MANSVNKTDDVPKADPVSQETTSEAAPEASEAPAAPKEPEVKKDTSGTFQESGSEGPTDLGEARKAARVSDISMNQSSGRSDAIYLDIGGNRA